ncbi:MAG TPA: aspartate/glutamate racemase family protein [Saprospiraceae bacterium]|nr:aspartate/glutamate racemase family protein [Saprospiraceae bacterium]
MMKTIGLIGGTTWLSTIEYYRIINQEVNKRLGGMNSAKVLLYSLNFEEFKPPSDPEAWGPIVTLLSNIAITLEKGGADCLVIGANTPHMVADQVQKNITIPIINIAEVTGLEIRKREITKAALLGTKFTMELRFFKDKLQLAGIETIIPDDIDREFVHNSIYHELAKGVFSEETKARYIEIIKKLILQGAEGVILGCTEIPLLISQEDSSIPIFDTTLIHANAAVDFALLELAR